MLRRYRITDTDQWRIAYASDAPRRTLSLLAPGHRRLPVILWNRTVSHELVLVRVWHDRAFPHSSLSCSNRELLPGPGQPPFRTRTHCHEQTCKELLILCLAQSGDQRPTYTILLWDDRIAQRRTSCNTSLT